MVTARDVPDHRRSRRMGAPRRGEEGLALDPTDRWCGASADKDDGGGQHQAPLLGWVVMDGAAPINGPPGRSPTGRPVGTPTVRRGDPATV